MVGNYRLRSGLVATLRPLDNPSTGSGQRLRERLRVRGSMMLAYSILDEAISYSPCTPLTVFENRRLNTFPNAPARRRASSG